MGWVRGRKWKEEKMGLYYYLKRLNETSILKNRGNKVDRTISLKFWNNETKYQPKLLQRNCSLSQKQSNRSFKWKKIKLTFF